MDTTQASPHEDAVMDVVGGDGGAGSGAGDAGYDVHRMDDGESQAGGELVAEVLNSTWHRQSTSACASWAALQPDHRHGYDQIRQRMSAWACVSTQAGKREKVAQNSKNSRGDRAEEVEDRCAADVAAGGQGADDIVGSGYRLRCDVRCDSKTNWMPGHHTGCGVVEGTNRLGDCSSMGDGEEDEGEENENLCYYCSRPTSNRIDPLLLM